MSAALLEIPDSYQRAETLRALLRTALPTPVKESLKQITILTVGSLEQSVANDLFGLELLLDQRLFTEFKEEAPEIWTPLLLYAGIDDILNYFSRPDATEIIGLLWDRLAESPDRDMVKKLYLYGLKDGLELNLKCVQAIEILIAKGQFEIIHPLLPLLHTANLRSIVIVERWLNHQDDTLNAYACLYHGEYFHHVSEANLYGILKLRFSDNIQTYSRSNILLNNGITRVKRAMPRKYNISEFDISIMQILSLNYVQEKQFIRKKSSLSHFLRDIKIDDISILEKTFSNGDYYPIFKSANDLSADCLEYIVNLLNTREADKPTLENTLNILIQNLCEHLENKIPVYLDIHHALAENYKDFFKGYKFLPDNIFTLLKAYDESYPKTIQEVDSILDTMLMGLDEIIGQPFFENKDHIENGLLIAYGYYYGDNYIFKKNEPIKILKQKYNDQVFEFFAKWLLFLSQNKANEEKIVIDIREELLIITLAIWTGERNISILNSINIGNRLYDMLITRTNCENSATLLAIINMLKYFDLHTEDGIKFLISNLNNSSDIQTAAINTLKSIKIVDESYIDLLFGYVSRGDALLGGICVSILSNYAKNSNTRPKIRSEIISRFLDLLDDPNTQKGIYRYSGTQGTVEDRVRVQYEGRLDEVIFKELQEIVDI